MFSGHSPPSRSGPHLGRCWLQVTGRPPGTARLPLRVCLLLLLEPDQLRRPHLSLEQRATCGGREVSTVKGKAVHRNRTGASTPR